MSANCSLSTIGIPVDPPPDDRVTDVGVVVPVPGGVDAGSPTVAVGAGMRRNCFPAFVVRTIAAHGPRPQLADPSTQYVLDEIALTQEGSNPGGTWDPLGGLGRVVGGRVVVVGDCVVVVVGCEVVVVVGCDVVVVECVVVVVGCDVVVVVDCVVVVVGCDVVVVVGDVDVVVVGALDGVGPELHAARPRPARARTTGTAPRCHGDCLTLLPYPRRRWP